MNAPLDGRVLNVSDGLIVRLCHSLVLDVVPQCRHKLGRGYRARVMCQKPQHKDAVMAQIPPHKRVRFLAILLAIESFDERQVSLDVAPLSGPVGESEDPHEEREERENADEHQPEPDEQEDLLVEEVDRQHALDVVVVHGTQPANFEVAHRHPRKHDRRLHGPLVQLPRVGERVA